MSARELFDVDDVTFYHVELQIKGVMVGGVPSSESSIRGWIRSRMEVQDVALDELVQQTLRERFQEREPSTDEMITELMKNPDLVSVNGFKRAENGELAYEGRCMKAAIKEFANSSYPGTDWPGKAEVSKGFRKGLMTTAAERVFVEEIYIGLGVKAAEISKTPGVGPAWIEERVKHVMTPQGPKSAISTVEVVERPRLAFTLKVHDDFLPRQAWGRIWARGEDIGIGADRSRSDGQFELLRFDKVDG